MRGDICFSRFSAPAYLWLQFAVAELLILAASAIIRERLLRPFLRVMLLKSATAKWERLQKTVAKPFPIEPRGSFCRFLAASSQLSTYLIGFNLTALSRPGLTLLSILHVIYQIICSPWFLLIHSILSVSLGKRSKQNGGHNAKWCCFFGLRAQDALLFERAAGPSVWSSGSGQCYRVHQKWIVLVLFSFNWWEGDERRMGRADHDRFGHPDYHSFTSHGQVPKQPPHDRNATDVTGATTHSFDWLHHKGVSSGDPAHQRFGICSRWV